MTAYYNEIDPFCAETLRGLISEGRIASGIVDERDIRDIPANELSGFTQCHFFAGIGIWSLALRNAGWPDERQVWTGSCPCQPFSAAGQQRGFNDERHLWPAFQWLISKRQPDLVLGEQVRNGGWIDLAHADMEGMGYAFGCSAVAACGFGAPFVGDRAYWVAASDWHQQSWEEPRSWPAGRVGRFIKSVPQDRAWPAALAEFRSVGDGHPRCVGATDAIRNAMHVPTVTTFIEAVMDLVPC